jgi:hypothetical protein
LRLQIENGLSALVYTAIGQTICAEDKHGEEKLNPGATTTNILASTVR